MTKTTIFKTVALAAAILGGVNCAWADTSTLYNWGTTTDGGATVWTDAEKGVWTGSAPSIDATYGLGVTGSNSHPISIRNIGAVDGSAILTYDIIWYVNTVSYSANFSYYSTLKLGNFLEFKVGTGQKEAQITSGETVQTFTLANTTDNQKTDASNYDLLKINCVVNTVTKKITALSIKEVRATEDVEVLNLTSFSASGLQLTSLPTFSTVALEAYSTNNARNCQSRLQSIKIQQDTQDLTEYGYTIKYMIDLEDDETAVKTEDMTADENKVYNGSVVYAENSFWVSTTKYYATDDATTMFTIDSDNKVCKVKVREASTWNWTIKGRIQTVGTDLGVVNSGTVTEGETVTGAYYKNMLLYENKLYKKDAINNDFQVDFTPTDDDYVQQYDYSATDYDNVILLKEAEDVATLTQPSIYYLGSRMSGGKGAYADGADAEVLSLPAGTYKLSAKVIKNANSFEFYYGENTNVLTATADAIKTGVEFTLNSTTPIKLKKGVKTANGGGKACLDYFFVQQTAGIVPNCDNLGYTFSCPVPLDFTESSVRAYIATYDSEKDVMRLTQVTKVPANTGVLVFSDSELTNQSVPVTAESTDDVTGNKLVAVSSDMTLEAGTGDVENYVLALEGGKTVFQLVNGTSASMTAGQAYLQIPKRTVEGARSLRIMFDDETTAINEKGIVTSEKSATAHYYDLQGRRIAQPTKGLYMKNGRKVVVK